MDYINLFWEDIGNRVSRTKVPGGWLLTYDNLEGGGITFLPDSTYSWFGNDFDTNRDIHIAKPKIEKWFQDSKTTDEVVGDTIYIVTYKELIQKCKGENISERIMNLVLEDLMKTKAYYKEEQKYIFDPGRNL